MRTEVASRVLKNTGYLVAAGGIVQLLGFVSVFYLARVLGPADFGQVAFATAIVGYFTLLTDMGIPLFATQQIARDKTKTADGYVADVCFLRLSLAFLSMALLFVLVLVMRKPADTKFLILLFGLNLLPTALLIDWVFQGRQEMQYTALGRIVSKVVYVVLVFAFVNSSAALLRIPLFQLAGSVISVAVLLGVYVRRFGLSRPSFDLNNWKRIFRAALPLGISIVMIQVMYSIDTVLLGVLRTDEEIGYYSAAYKIVLVIISIGAVYFDAIFPLATSYYETSLDSLRVLQRYTAKLIVSAACPMAMGGVVLAGPIMRFFYGQRYDSGIIAFQILIWAAAFIYLNMIYARGMWACNLRRAYVRIVSLQAAVNVILNLILIPRYGITGAAISTLVAEFCGLYFYYREFSRIVRVDFHGFLLKPMLAAAAMSGLLLLVPDLNLFARLMGGFIVYLALLYGLNGIAPEDIRLLKAVLQQKKGS